MPEGLESDFNGLGYEVLAEDDLPEGSSVTAYDPVSDCDCEVTFA